MSSLPKWATAWDMSAVIWPTSETSALMAMASELGPMALILETRASAGADECA